MKAKRSPLVRFLIAGMAVMALLGACTKSKPEQTRLSDKSRSGQTESRRLFNGEQVMNKMSIGEQVEMYWKFFFEKGEKTPMEPLPQQQVDLAELLNGDEGSGQGLKAAWLGHSSVLINIDGHLILTDPVFERKVSIVGPTRFNEELPVTIEELPPLDVVIISHDHYDHLNKFSVQQLAGKTNVFVVPLGVGERLVKWGVPSNKIVEMNWWDEIQPTSNLTIAATPAQHFSGRGLLDRNRTLWASWVIMTPKHRVFFSGDTGYFDGFKKIGRKYGPFDVTFLECGAYNERWSNIHMLPEQTVQAFFDLGGRILQPIHWGTYNLALHPWYEPMERLTGEAWRLGAPIATPVMGRVLDYDRPLTAERWWVPAMQRSRELHKGSDLAASYSRNS